MVITYMKKPTEGEELEVLTEECCQPSKWSVVKEDVFTVQEKRVEIKHSGIQFRKCLKKILKSRKRKTESRYSPVETNNNNNGI